MNDAGVTPARNAWVVRPRSISFGPYMSGVAFLSIWVASFWPTWHKWVSLWLDNPQYEHGPILAAMCAALLLGALRTPVSRSHRKSDAPWVAGLALGSLAWLVSWLAGVAALQQVLVAASGWLAIRVAFGSAAARRALFPTFGLLFASEIWEHAAVVLQYLTTSTVGLLLRFAAFPVHISGNHIEVPAGEFVVEEGCSGVKYLITMLMLACLAIRMGQYSWRSRLTLIGSAAAIAVVANWFRVLSLIWIGQATNLRHPLMHDHYMFGWAIFCVALVPVVLLALRLSGYSASPAESPGSERDLVPGRLPARPAVVAALILTACALLPAEWIGRANRGVLTAPMLVAQSAGCGREPRGPPLGSRALQVDVGGDRARFNCPAGSVDLEVARLRLPFMSDTLDELLAGVRGSDKLVQISDRSGVLVRSDNSVIRFSERELAAPNRDKKIVRYWFSVGGRTFPHSGQAKLTAAVHALFGRGQLTIFVADTDCTTECNASRALLDKFMGALAP